MRDNLTTENTEVAQRRFELLSICFVSQEYPEETGWGGIGTYTFEIAHGLARAGHRVTVLSRALKTPQHYFEADGVEVYRVLPSLSVDSLPVVWRLNRYWEGYRLAVAMKLNQLVRERHIDVIESPELHAEPLLFALAKPRPPLVIRLHSGSQVISQFEPDVAHHAKANRRIESWLIKKAAVVTSPSEALRASLNGALGSRSVKVVPNPVDVDHFKPDSQSGEPDSMPNVLSVGRPRFLKGFHVLAKAIPMIWKENPATSFTFVPAPMGTGGGSPADAYSAILGDLVDDPRIQIVARTVTRATLSGFYQRATICAVPSLWEAFGYVCAEAMACGVPVIASRTGGLAEIIEEGKSGLLVEPGNAEALAEAIVSLIRDPVRRAQIGAAARNRVVTEFSSATIAARMTSLYQQVIQHP